MANRQPESTAQDSRAYSVLSPITSNLSSVPPRLLLAIIIVLSLAARLVPGARTIDDAYITFRYARNLLAGHGFTYNPGEAVLGTTTPLYALLITALGAVSGGSAAPLPLIALAVNAVADALTCLILLDLGRRLGSAGAGAGAALVWAVAPFSVTFAIGGLETSVYVLLLTATARAYLLNHMPLAAGLAALSLLTRPDALLFVAPLAGDRLWRLIKQPRAKTGNAKPGIRLAFFFRRLAGEILPFFLPLAAWLLFATNTFGTPIPHSVAAKSLAYRLPPEAGLVRLIQHYATPFLGHLTFGLSWIGIGLVLYPFLFLVGAGSAMRRAPRLWPFFLFPWLYLATFAFANPLIFRWYLTPPLPAYILGILLGADRLLSDILRKLEPARFVPGKTSRLAALILALVITLAPLGLSLRGWTLRPDHGFDRPSPEMAWYKLELLYRQAASLVRDQVDTNTVLAAGDVGVLGYYLPARILDTVGLNSPQTLRYYPIDPSFYTINYAVSPDLIIDERPDYLVILEVYGREGLLKDPRFLNSYRLVEELPTDIYGSRAMLVFTRLDVP